jgi:hypothetical protein
MPGPKRRDLATRFWECVSPEPNSGCWLWLGPTQKSGHAQITLGGHKGKRAMAYRVSYEMFRGKIADGLMVCHHCDVPQCVNPAHLFLGTQKDNMQDAKAKGRTARGPRKAACGTCGRPFEGDNLIVKSNGWQACRHCSKQRARKHYLKTQDAQRTRRRRYYEDNLERLREMGREYHAANRDKRCAEMREYYRKRKTVQVRAP